MKKFLLCFSFFLITSLPVFAGSFPDVADDHENFEAIEYLDEHGIVDGYQDGTFGPENLVTRAEATKIIVGALGIDHEKSYSVSFPDVPADQWFFPYVMAAKENNIIDGYPDATFKPGNNVNLAELLKIVVLAAEVTLEDVLDNVFVDVDKDQWYAPHALYARNHNIILPDEFGYLHAEKEMTRAEFSEVVYRMMIVLESNGDPYPLDKNWDTYEGEILPFTMKYDSKLWQVIENENEVVFFRPDIEYNQFSPAKVYPNSAVVRVSMDPNVEGLSISDYFTNIENVFKGAEYSEFKIGKFDALEVLYSDERTVDWYIYLDDARVLVVYTEFGDGTLGYQLTQFIKAMLQTFSYTELKDVGGSDVDKELLSEILGNVLIEDMGMKMLDKVNDKIIVETDAIGVGTGPVDYYFSESLDYTFKYERDGDVILDTRKGQTTAF